MPQFVALLLSMAAGTASPAYVPTFDPGQLQDDVAGTPNEALILGSPHLAQLPKEFPPESIDPLLDRLTAWKPQIISIEAWSGLVCDRLTRHAAIHGRAWRSCWDPGAAQKAVGLDMAAATVEAQKLLGSWPAQPAPADRRRLAALFLAGGEPASALVQWLRLPVGERRAGDSLDETLVAALEKLMVSRNENYLIGSRLAARSGLDRVYATDDHSADPANALLNEDPAYGAAMQRIWHNPANKARFAEDRAAEANLDGEGLLALYRFYNRPAMARVAYDSDFGAALADVTPQNFGRRYVGRWETRNLRMVANIRAAMTARPGLRTLAIVGASHKGYFEAYLGMMHDVRLVDAEAILK